MDEIRELLDRMTSLSDAELTELEGRILSEFDAVENQDPTPAIVDSMTQLADALDTVRTELTARGEAAAELSRRKDEVLARVKGPATQPDAVGEPGDEEVDGDAGLPDEAAADVPDAAEAAAVADGKKKGSSPNPGPMPNAKAAAPAESAPAPVVSADAPTDADAANPPANELPKRKKAATPVSPGQDPTQNAAEGVELSTDETQEEESEAAVTAAAVNEPEGAALIKPPADRVAKPREVEAPVAIVAGADIPNITAGSALPDMRAVADAMVHRMKGLQRVQGGDGEQHTVASLVSSFPQERILSTDDRDGNMAKISDVTSVQAITAAGGICAPVNVRYDLFGMGGTDRPVKDALAPFSADRGGIRYVTPPALADLNGSSALWTLQDDIDAATPGAPDPTKPCIRVACGTETVVYTDAITLCLTFGNMNARAYPELVARHNELALVWHARFAETRLLTRIGALSTSVTSAHVIGAAPDFFVNLDRAGAAYRNRYRVDPKLPLRIILPAWFNDMLRADLAMRMPGDDLDGNLAAADATIASLFAARNVNVTWTLDGETGQVFGSQSAGSLLDFPSTMVWYLFAEGTFLFLDGGTLDLGLVRDSTLNATNDYKMFVESFEGVANVGNESYRVTSTLKVSGAAAGLVNTN